MARRRKKDQKAGGAVLPIMKPDAAGIDIGAAEMYVAVPMDRDTEALDQMNLQMHHVLADITGATMAPDARPADPAK